MFKFRRFANKINGAHSSFHLKFYCKKKKSWNSQIHCISTTGRNENVLQKISIHSSVQWNNLIDYIFAYWSWYLGLKNCVIPRKRKCLKCKLPLFMWVEVDSISLIWNYFYYFCTLQVFHIKSKIKKARVWIISMSCVRDHFMSIFFILMDHYNYRHKPVWERHKRNVTYEKKIGLS